MALIACDQITLAYEGRPVIEDLTLAINPGDFLCVVGENGSGKSTLVKGLLGLLQPLKGAITLGDGLQKNQIGYLPQRNQSQGDFPASVWEVVTSGCRSRGPFLNNGQKALARHTMALLSVEELAKQSFMELSGGQQQRVLLARALCAASKLLLLDEPVAGLDPLVTKELYRIMVELHQRHGLSIVMISHDIPAAIQHARHILHLSHGSSFYGTAAEYAVSPLGKAFAGGESHA